MTAEEKLEKAVEFIKQVSNAEFDVFSSSDVLDDIGAYCSDCGDNCIDTVHDFQYAYADVIENFKERAWHVLADITE